MKSKAKKLLLSEEGLKYRSKRPIEVEAVFGQLKSNNKFNRFTFIGLEKVEMEFLLMALGHNFRKMVAKGLSALRFTFETPKTILILACKIKNHKFSQTVFYLTRNLNLKSKIQKIAA